MNGGERDLTALLTGMRPHLAQPEYVFAVVDGPCPPGIEPWAQIVEDEGLTLVLAAVDAVGLEHSAAYRRITLQVHSALDAVGLTAAVSGALAESGIACNVIAGYHHDHLFVPAEDSDRAMDVLRRLSGPTIQ